MSKPVTFLLLTFLSCVALAEGLESTVPSMIGERPDAAPQILIGADAA